MDLARIVLALRAISGKHLLVRLDKYCPASAQNELRISELHVGRPFSKET